MKVLLITAAVLITAVPLVAHHGAATFDTEKELTLKGTVTEWIWANPHCFLKFDAKDDTGIGKTITHLSWKPSAPMSGRGSIMPATRTATSCALWSATTG